MNPNDALKRKEAEKRLEKLRSDLKAAEKDDSKQDEKRSIEGLIRIEERILYALDQGRQFERLFNRSGDRQKLLDKVVSNKNPTPSSPSEKMPVLNPPTYQSINQRQEILNSTTAQASSSVTNATNFERKTTELAEFHENYFTNSLVSFFRCCFCCPENDEEETLIARNENTIN